VQYSTPEACVIAVFFLSVIDQIFLKLTKKVQVNLVKKCVKTKDDGKFLSYSGQTTEMSQQKHQLL